MRSLSSVLMGLVTVLLSGQILSYILISHAPREIISSGVISGGYAIACVFCSQLSNIAGGYITGRIARSRIFLHATLLAAISTAIGIWVASMDWHQAPLWYHVAEIALVAPVTVAGAWIAERRHKLLIGN